MSRRFVLFDITGIWRRPWMPMRRIEDITMSESVSGEKQSVCHSWDTADNPCCGRNKQHKVVTIMVWHRGHDSVPSSLAASAHKNRCRSERNRSGSNVPPVRRMIETTHVGMKFHRRQEMPLRHMHSYLSMLRAVDPMLRSSLKLRSQPPASIP